MLILITENRQKPKTELNYFNKFLKIIGEKEIFKYAFKCIPKKVVWFKNMAKLKQNKEKILKYKNIFLICDNENENKKWNSNIKNEIILWKKSIEVIDTNNHKKKYKFENFLCSHFDPNNSKKDCSYFGSKECKSNENIFDFAARKFHFNIMQKDNKHLVKLINHLGKKTYGAYKIMEYITTKLKK